jgi:hypothetical protein
VYLRLYSGSFHGLLSPGLNRSLTTYFVAAGMDAGKTKGAAGSHVSSRMWNKNKCQNYTRDAAFHGSTYKVEW